MTQRPPHDRQSESGNIFTILVAAVGLLGLLSFATYNILSGPVATMARVNQRTLMETQQQGNARLLISLAVTNAEDGDCDDDTYVEPMEWRSGTGPTNGGLLPSTMGLMLTDPYGTEYGYCVWDVGPDNVVTVADTAACDDDDGTGADNNRLRGDDDVTTGTEHSVFVIVSAGQNQTFESTCANWDASDAVDLFVLGGDDKAMEFSYAEASALGGGVWNIKAGDSATAQVDKELEIKSSPTATELTRIGAQTIDSTAYESVGDFLAIKTDNIYDRGGLGIALKDVINLDQSGSTDHEFNGIFMVKPKGAPDTLNTTGEGTRMFFYPQTGALRAGIIDDADGALGTDLVDTQWDDTGTNLEAGSVAFGINTTASGQGAFAAGDDFDCFFGIATYCEGPIASGRGSIALGLSSRASGRTSFAMGLHPEASGNESVAIGNNATASETNAIALGRFASASALGAMAIGHNVTASGTYSLAMGQYMTAAGANSAVFGAGNPSGATSSSVAASGTASVLFDLDDNTLYTIADANTMAIMGGEVGVGNVSPSQTLHNTGIFLNTGKGSAETLNVSGAGTRMFFYPGDGAIRAGVIEDTDGVGTDSEADEWDEANIGVGSAAFGRNVLASGAGSFAAGDHYDCTYSTNECVGPQATARGAIALGIATTASGEGSLAAGWETIAGGSYSSFAMGYDSDATGTASFTFGDYNTSSNTYAVTMGTYNTASGISTIALGRRMTASGARSFAFGTGDNTLAGGYANSDNQGQDSFLFDLDNNTAYTLTDNNTMAIMGGEVGIGTVSPTDELYVSGDATVTGTFTNPSDRRLKDITGTFEHGLDRILKLSPTRFKYKKDNPRKIDSGENRVGLIAQDVEQLIPEAISEKDDGYLHLDMQPVTLALINSVKELKAENDELREEVALLRDDIDRLAQLAGLPPREHEKASLDIPLYMLAGVPVAVIFAFGAGLLFRKRIS